jgi:hypothetical protein
MYSTSKFHAGILMASEFLGEILHKLVSHPKNNRAKWQFSIPLPGCLFDNVTLCEKPQRRDGNEAPKQGDSCNEELLPPRNTERYFEHKSNHQDWLNSCRGSTWHVVLANIIEHFYLT